MELHNLYTYAFLNTPDVPLDLPIGFAGQVLLVDSVGLSVLVEPGLPLELLQNHDEKLVEMVLTHDRVINEVFRQTSVLPLRFGTSFISKTSLLTHLKSNVNEYREKLKNINGKSEYLVKLIPCQLEQPESLVKVSGKQYFLAKKQRYQNQQDFETAQNTEWHHLIDSMSQLYQSTVVAQPQGEEQQIYLLVNSQDEALLIEQILNWQQDCLHWQLHLGGAFPPYHFI
ncbi:MAG: GvpL/GvpF family gas vesicle protein [Scytonema sp. PMC 1069.18]|nr:GvpL/GvpF family gas vesicle protein [Scytonema sp. PMC 1069.18]MEC4887029.1 GvpL/GvpF family gas vesicle protein [Scytonema sp. PMC 1070.18]